MHQLQSLANVQPSPDGQLGRFVVGVLDDGQRERWEEEVRLRRAELFEVGIARGITHFVLRHGLTARQHAALAELVTAARSRIDVGRAELFLGSGNPMLVNYLVSQIAPERIATILDERQRESFATVIAGQEDLFRHIEASVVREE